MNIHDLYRPFLKYFRSKRMHQFEHRFSLTAETHVLDVGVNLFNWSFVSTMPNLTIVNLYLPSPEERNCTFWVVADSRHLPFKDSAFDTAYSNSVIEHLDDFASQQALAEEICRELIATMCKHRTDGFLSNHI